MKRFALNALRLVLSFIFLWAFFDKVFGLGFATTHDQAWIRGSSPTTGFLTKAVHGPFAGFFHALAGHAIVDWLFMLGLLGIGISLLTGIWIRFMSIVGAIFVILLFLSAVPPENNPLFDEHIVYALAFLLIAASAHHYQRSAVTGPHATAADHPQH